MLAARLNASPQEDIEISSVRIQITSLAAQATIGSMRLFHDVGKDGHVDEDDVLLGVVQSVSGEDASVTFTLDALQIPAGSEQDWLLVASLARTVRSACNQTRTPYAFLLLFLLPLVRRTGRRGARLVLFLCVVALACSGRVGFEASYQAYLEPPDITAIGVHSRVPATVRGQAVFGPVVTR